jgi:hypothetical protein
LFVPLLAYWYWLVHRASSANEANAILERAVNAHGGAESIWRTATGRLAAKGKVIVRGTSEWEVTWKETFQLPDRFTRLLTGRIDGKNVKRAYVLDKDGKAWIKEGDEGKKLFGSALATDRCWYAPLVSLMDLKESDVARLAGGQSLVNSRPAVSVHFSTTDGASELYFDLESGLLVKAKYEVAGLFGTSEYTTVEFFYSDFRDIDGVQFPQKVSARTGRGDALELAIVQLDFLDEIPDSEFALP